jgi:hypothetical protein
MSIRNNNFNVLPTSEASSIILSTKSIENHEGKFISNNITLIQSLIKFWQLV